MICKLCEHTIPLPESESQFVHCTNCDLIMKREHSFPLFEEERTHYLLHENGPQYAGYVKFLNRAITPIASLLSPNMHALDYGCGPGPAMDYILKGYGVSCDNYDPIFESDGIKKEAYDLILATECLEHFHYPVVDLKKIVDLIKVNGILSIMTNFHQGREHTENWFYTKEFTHVAFYSIKTMHWIANYFNLELIHTDDTRVVVFKKSGI